MSLFQKIFLLVIFIVQETALAQRQPDYPVIGQKCPEFRFTTLSHFPAKSVSLNDFHGKWLIMDFWTLSCQNCIKSFPKLKDLQHSFSDRVQFLLVATNANKEGKMYEKLYLKYSMSIPCAYDSSLFSRYGIEGVPHIVIIDPEGFVYAVTTSQYLDEDHLKELISGRNPYFETKLNAFQKEKSDSLGGRDKEIVQLHESSLSVWRKGQTTNIVTNIDRAGTAYYKTSAISLKRLYNIAYLGYSDWGYGDSLYGRFWPSPVVDTLNSLTTQKKFDQERLYNYYLRVPDTCASISYLQWAMQCDLKKFFGFEVSIERKVMPCWKLVDRAGKEKLVSRGGVQSATINYDGVVLSNCSVDALLKAICDYNEGEQLFIDATGIRGKIDLRLNAIMTDFQDVRASLRRCGFELVESTVLINVLVLRERLMLPVNAGH